MLWVPCNLQLLKQLLLQKVANFAETPQDMNFVDPSSGQTALMQLSHVLAGGSFFNGLRVSQVSHHRWKHRPRGDSAGGSVPMTATGLGTWSGFVCWFACCLV